MMTPERDDVNQPAQTPRLGDLLRAARHRAGLTLEELCAQAGLGLRTVSDLERNRVTRPHRHTIDALIATLALDSAERRAIRASARPPRETRPTNGTPTNARPTRSDTLPPDHHDLFGVEAELRALHEWFDGLDRTTRCPWPVVISGMPGVGKTRFAVRVGRDLADRFPDSRIHLDLRGTGEQPMDTAEAVGQLLRRMGLADDELPATVEERGHLLRARMRASATLLILDDVRDEAQARALLPDDVGAGLVILVSRRTLAGVEAARRVTLGELDPHSAVDLLGALAGHDRMAAEAAGAADLARLCGFLPLALRIVGNRLASRPNWTVTDMAERLRPADERLSHLANGDLDVRAAFARSYRLLAPEVRQVFRRLALVRGGTVHANRLSGGGFGDTERALEELVDASLLNGTEVTGRYRLNELLRLFARETLATEESAYSIEQLTRDTTGEWLRSSA